MFGQNHLLNADCSNRANQIRYDRFSCLNRCFKRLKISSGFYHFDDDRIFDLGEIFNRKIVKRDVSYEIENLDSIRLPTPNVIKGAEKCLRKCPERSCFWEVVITLKIDRLYYEKYLLKEGKDKVNLQLNTYAAFYSMDDFYLQLFGLLALFTGTSVLRLLHAVLAWATKRIEPLLKNEKLLRTSRLVHQKLKAALTLLSFVLVLTQGLAMVNEFRFHSSYPNRTSSLNFSSEPFSVVICFPILVYEDGKTNEGKKFFLLRNLRDHETQGNSSTILREFNFTVLENRSYHLLYSEIRHFEVFSGNKAIRVEFKISNEVLFKGSKFNDTSYLSGCLRVDFDFEERYRKMPLTHLVISFKTRHKELYLIERNRNFTSDLVNFEGLFYLLKKTKKYSPTSEKFTCRDYSKEPDCDSRRNCLDQCQSSKFIVRHRSIPTNTVVRKGDLPFSMLNESLHFNVTVDRGVQEECSALFNQTDCNEVRFEESPDRAFSEMFSFIHIRLSYMNIVEREIEYDPVKTILDIVGLETVLFGSNALGLLTTVLLFLCRTLRLKWHRAYSVFLFLLASAGFLAHNVLVFRAIINGDLHENEFFEKPERYSLPSPIFCFPAVKIDKNHRVTGRYLDDVTARIEVTFEKIFSKIVYNNRTHSKVLHISQLNSSNANSSNFYSCPELKLSHFYYLGMKCFKTSLRVSFKEEDFFLLQSKSVLRIYLLSRYVNQKIYTLFFHQQADSSELGGGFAFEIGTCEGFPNVYRHYKTEFELFRVVREDQFELLKDPRRLFQKPVKMNDVTEFQDATRKRFKEDYNRTTNDLPLDRYFEVELDNELFEQFFRHERTEDNSDKMKFKSLDFEQNVANVYTNLFYLPFETKYPDFSFSFSFLVRRVVVTNRENYTKLVVSLLNTLSLWLGICVIDMGAWVSRLVCLIRRLHRLLIRTRNLLKLKI